MGNTSAVLFLLFCVAFSLLSLYWHVYLEIIEGVVDIEWVVIASAVALDVLLVNVRELLRLHITVLNVKLLLVLLLKIENHNYLY